jgi:hypothetical protein
MVRRESEVHTPYTHFMCAPEGIAHYEGMTESILLAAEYGTLIREHDLATA